MNLIPDDLKAIMLANFKAGVEADDDDDDEDAEMDKHDPKPVVKLFTPDAGATWSLSELDPEDNDRAFGLCDLGMGYPELGYVSLAEIEALRGPIGLKVERDLHFTAKKTLIEYADQARLAGRIVA